MCLKFTRSWNAVFIGDILCRTRVTETLTTSLMVEIRKEPAIPATRALNQSWNKTMLPMVGWNKTNVYFSFIETVRLGLHRRGGRTARALRCTVALHWQCLTDHQTRVTASPPATDGRNRLSIHGDVLISITPWRTRDDLRESVPVCRNHYKPVTVSDWALCAAVWDYLSDSVILQLHSCSSSSPPLLLFQFTPSSCSLETNVIKYWIDSRRVGVFIV